MKKDSSKVVVKKVKAYPIAAELTNEKTQEKHVGKLYLVNRTGVQVLCEHNFFVIGENLIIRFEFPVLKKTIEERVFVVKSVVKLLVSKNSKQHLIEMHFKNLKPASANAITSYAVQIGQKP